MLDVVGPGVAARDTDYVAAALASAVGDGRAPPSAMRGASASTTRRSSTARPRTARISTTPSRAGRCMPARSIVPAVLAVAEQRGLDGRRGDARHRGRRRADVPAEPRRAAGDPQGRLPSDRGLRRAGRRGRRVGAALGLRREAIARALGIAGSLASGIIEYLADGSWTKRLHAGAAAQAGLRAALLAEAGFIGPAHRARRQPRLLQGVRAVEDAGLRAAARRPRRALGHRRRSPSSPMPAGP